MGIDMDAGGDRTGRSDRNAAAGPVEHDVGPDPGTGADPHVAENNDALVDARALAEAEFAGALPAIEQRILQRQAAAKLGALSCIAPAVQRQHSLPTQSPGRQHGPPDRTTL